MSQDNPALLPLLLQCPTMTRTRRSRKFEQQGMFLHVNLLSIITNFSRPSRHNPYLRTGPSTSGPKIREISDEEAEAEQSKRRKGMFGKFFGPTDNN